jgi:ABC-2 type transport system permease protein
MQHELSAMVMIRRIASKEITLFFSSPIAYLFLGTFAAVTLFVFFWGEAFFSRNIADVGPLFEWMPLLLIFLCSTLTMRLWCEERRTGTLEHVITQPLPLWHFVLGKFFACLFLLAIALLITVPLPVTVAIIGELDWGPVLAGYLATFLLGAAYLSIGLLVSARTDNQIVSLITAVCICSIFYLLGNSTVTDFFGVRAGEWLRLLGTGSRFDAITRGVIDIRDLYYYLSLIAVFLVLNTYVLERERWASVKSSPHHQYWLVITVLLIANALGANLWLGQINGLRIDATAGNQYSISDATKSYLAQLQEPLMLRGYFSSKTHPLLSPLVPQLRNLMREYEIAGDGQIRVEFIDPISNPDLEEEANQKYGISPVPFQVADRYQSSIVSSYFNVLVQYGDEHEVLGFRDLIEIKARQEADLNVQLRNPEHDLTRAIKRVLQSYQAAGNLFDTVKQDLLFTAYVSGDAKLPEKLLEFKQTAKRIVDQAIADSAGRLQAKFIDPDENDQNLAQQIAQDYGFRPMATNLFSNDRFYFYLTLAEANSNKAGQLVQIPLADMSEDSFERNLNAAIKRFASGFTKTVALVTSEEKSAQAQFRPGGSKYRQLESFLGSELKILREDISDGNVSGEADMLLLLSPQELDEKQLFAVDQFLMQGGTIIAATSPYSASLSNRNLSLQAHDSGLQKWLDHHGLSIQQQLVLDPQNAAFPIPVTRNVGGFQLQEIRMLDYPYFVDVRGSGLNQENTITAELPQTTFAWASPISVDAEKNSGRVVTELLRSSDKAWLSSSTNIMPRMGQAGMTSYLPEGEQGSHALAVISAGRFNSYFADKSSPLLTKEEHENAESQASDTENTVEKLDESDEPAQFSTVIDKSPESARIILFASNDFLTDQVTQMAGTAGGSEYLNTYQLLNNAIDWSLEDGGLLSIRARSHFNRTLPPMPHKAQLFWEYLNYGLLIVLLVIVALLQARRHKARQRAYRQLFAN